VAISSPFTTPSEFTAGRQVARVTIGHRNDTLGGRRLATRLLFIGLDAYDKDLLLQWAAAGVLPTLRSLLQTATWGTTQNPPGLYAASVWESFITGVTPDRHRRFFRHQARRGEYLHEDFLPGDLEVRPFWELLSDAGQRVAILNTPHAPLCSTLNGVLLVDWGTDEPFFERPVSYPPQLVSELEHRFGQPAVDRCDSMERTPDSFSRFLAELAARTQNTLDISQHILHSSEWDLLSTTFSAAHCVGHQCWHLHDPTHPRYDRALRERLGDPLELVYRQLDDALGQLLGALDDATTVLVLASHGMGPLRGTSVVFDEILRRLEQHCATPSTSAYERIKRSWYRLPSRWRNSSRLRSAKNRIVPQLHRTMLVPDRQARRYFAIPHNPHAGAVRINLAGRETHGIVQPGEEYRALCQQLRDDLLALVDPVTGTPAVSEVRLVADDYDGPYVDELPDLLVEWTHRGPSAAIHSPRIGTLHVPDVGTRTGDHLPEGLFFARLPLRPPAPLRRTVSVIDFAPTIAAWLGVPLNGIQGQPITEVIP
jgi:predicted AlkP superfamily phosphohydrolase/phosphomutase